MRLRRTGRAQAERAGRVKFSRQGFGHSPAPGSNCRQANLGRWIGCIKDSDCSPIDGQLSSGLVLRHSTLLLQLRCPVQYVLCMALDFHPGPYVANNTFRVHKKGGALRCPCMYGHTMDFPFQTPKARSQTEPSSSEPRTTVRLCLSRNLPCLANVSLETPIILMSRAANSASSSVNAIASLVHPGVSSFG